LIRLCSLSGQLAREASENHNQAGPTPDDWCWGAYRYGFYIVLLLQFPPDTSQNMTTEALIAVCSKLFEKLRKLVKDKEVFEIVRDLQDRQADLETNAKNAEAQVASFQNEIATMKEQHASEIERLNTLHSQEMAEMKELHADEIARLKQPQRSPFGAINRPIS
jgi:hypothetical protein